MAKKLNERSVLQIASEALPFAKTGGLADVLGALPPALARLGWDVTVVTPRYRGVTAGSLVERFPVTVGGFVADAGFFEAPLPDSARAILIDCPDLYDRDALYGVDNVDYTDNARRFAFLVRAALEFAARRAAAPSIVHAHDWQAGVAPVYLRTLYAGHPVLRGTRISSASSTASTRTNGIRPAIDSSRGHTRRTIYRGKRRQRPRCWSATVCRRTPMR